MRAATMTSAPLSRNSLDHVLRPIHAIWIDDARGALEPALEPDADFWARWTAARYLAEDFRDRYRRERALVEELLPFLRANVVDRLLREDDRVYRLRIELDRICRRRGTTAEIARSTVELVKQLRAWCAEIERAACEVTREELTAEGAELLAQLEATPRYQRGPALTLSPGGVRTVPPGR
jgi:hypothetical protein